MEINETFFTQRYLTQVTYELSARQNTLPGESGFKGKQMTIRRKLAQAVAPYKVEFAPINIFQSVQVIHCWTFSDALAWAKCALNTDLVTITNKYNGRIAARRYSI